MKTVFTDISQIAHLWANKLQDNARNSGNFYFNRNIIYSYGSHFPIAKHISINNINAVLFTKRSYSNTTAGHINVVRQASNHLNIIYCPDVENTHTDNFNSWLRGIENIGANLKNTRKPEIYLNKISYEFGQVQKYANYFSIAIPELLQSAGAITDKAEYLAYNSSRDALLIKQAENKLKADKKAVKKQLIEWRLYKTRTLYNRIGVDYLRFNSEKNRVETSQGIEIPLEIAKKFYTYILKTIKNGGCTVCDSKILDYSVTEINSKFIKVGCHKIELSEINKMAKLLSWI